MKNKNIDISGLIEAITPLNNKYRDLVNNSSKASSVLEVMWDVGEYLDAYLKNSGIKPHSLYWQIYGKAEGLRHSYITRDFLSYCLRINKYFVSKKAIKKIYPNLKPYSLFREAFPLLENSKFQLATKDRLGLIKLLNSDLEARKIKNKIIELKKERIGVTNSRRQKLSQMAPYVETFVIFYNYVYSLIKSGNYEEIEKLNRKISKNYLNEVSQLISGLTQENLFIPKLELEQSLPSQWKNFIIKITELFNSSIETRNRFRRIFPPKKLIRLSEMVVALIDQKSLLNFKKKNDLI